MIRKFMYLIIICILASSCSNYHYAVIPQYVPLNTRKGEITANINLRTLQLGYSLTNHFAMHALLYADIIDETVKNGEGLLSVNDGANAYYRNSSNIILGGSYFLNSHKFIFELLGGAGAGSTRYRHRIYKDTDDEYVNTWLNPPYEFSMDTKNFIYYVQPDIGFKFCKYVNLGLSGKLTLTTYHVKDRTLDFGAYQNSLGIDSTFIYNNTAKQYFFEPALTLQTGVEKYKFQTQFISAFSLNNPDPELSRLKIKLSFFMSL